MAKKITINEIAKLARVSKGTVSKVLNNKPGIGVATRERVLALVNDVDYHPSPVAQALAGNRTGSIGLIIPHEAGKSLNGYYWSSLITSITQGAATEGYTLMIFTPRKEGYLQEVTDSLLNTKRVDGLIIGSDQMEKSSLEELQRGGIPFVLIGENPEFPHHFVDVDNHSATCSMTRHMIQQGYKKIGYISGPRSFYYNQVRVGAYKEIMREQNLHPLFSEADQYTARLTYAAVDKLLDSEKNLEGIFIGAGGDFLYDVLSRLKERGMDLHSLGLAVFDDYRYLDFMEPRITAIKQPLDQLGEKATTLLLKLIRNEIDEKETSEILSTSIILRGSCSKDLELRS